MQNSDLKTERELLPCPFCKSTDIGVGVRPEFKDAHAHRPIAYAFICDDCLGQTGWCPTEDIARRRWNMREGYSAGCASTAADAWVKIETEDDLPDDAVDTDYWVTYLVDGQLETDIAHYDSVRGVWSWSHYQDAFDEDIEVSHKIIAYMEFVFPSPFAEGEK